MRRKGCGSPRPSDRSRSGKITRQHKNGKIFAFCLHNENNKLLLTHHHQPNLDFSRTNGPNRPHNSLHTTGFLLRQFVHFVRIAGVRQGRASAVAGVLSRGFYGAVVGGRAVFTGRLSRVLCWCVFDGEWERWDEGFVLSWVC